MYLLKRNYRRLAAIGVAGLMIVIVGCGQVNSPNQEDTNILPTPNQAVVDSFALSLNTTSSDQATGLACGTHATYAYGVVPWYDRNGGDTDWMVVFYLPYNPGSANFEGLTWAGLWTNFNTWVQVYDARWTSSGFRIMILAGNKVKYLCGASPSRYRLVY